jgi:splicing factor 45
VATIASLRFQPTKRPQIAAQKAKAKAIASKFAPPPAANSAIPPPPAAVGTTVSDQPLAPQPASTKTTIADWTTTAEDDENTNDFFGGEKRPRGGRKKRKKNRAAEEIVQNWDDIYDPSRPNNYEDYKNSDEKIREVREWKDRLYAHRLRRRSPSAYSSDESRDRARLVKNSMNKSGQLWEVSLTIVTRAICTSTCNIFCSPSKSQQWHIPATTTSLGI